MGACGNVRTRLCRFVAMTLVAAAAWAARPAVAGAQTELPPEVRQALERNARAFAPIALTLEKQRSLPEPPSALGRKIADQWSGFLRPCRYEYLSQDGLCHARFNLWVRGSRLNPETHQMEEGLRERRTELSWDGKFIYRGAENLQPQILSIVPIGSIDSDGELNRVTWYNEDDYLGMIGIAVPRAMKELPEGPQSEVLRLLEGDGHVTGIRMEREAGGMEHFVVELLSGGKKHRFWLDPSLGHAVRRHEVWAASEALAVVIDNSDFVKLTDPELWLPRHCRAEWHTWPLIADKEFSRETAVVVDIQATRLERAHEPREKFTLKYDKPGTYISDGGLSGAEKAEGGRIEYVVPADPANLEEAIRAAQQRSGYVPPRGPLVLWIIGGSIVLGTAVIGIVLIRRRRGGPTTP
jgi:hypothetical protein